MQTIMTPVIERLLLYHPFFANLALRLEYQERTDIPVMCIDGKAIGYNPKGLSDYTLNEQMGILAHEIAHMLLFHHLRNDNYDDELWNKACDYAVNLILTESNIRMPFNALYDPSYKNIPAEDIYKLLYADAKGKNENGQNSPDSNEAGNDPNNSKSGKSSNDEIKPEQVGIVKPCPSESSIKEEKEKLTQMIVEAAIQTELAGSLSDNLKEIIQELKEPKQDWREILQHFVAEVSQNDYDWEVPDKNYLQRNIYIPSLNSLSVGGIVFALDTSSSVDKELLKDFLSEIKEAASLFTDDILVIHCDTKIQHTEEVSEDEIENIIPQGRGGTRFVPVFDYIERNDVQPKALVYFTDGYCYDKLEEPSYPVIWAIYGNKRFKKHFGTVIFVD